MSHLPKVAAYGHSHVGTVREENQDALRIDEPTEVELSAGHGYLYALADGMGGYSHGGVASNLALETFAATFYAGRAGKSPNNLRQAVQAANIAVYQKAVHLKAARMGTTLTALNILGNTLHLAHVGDSRAYLIRNHQATLLTQDHTAVGDLVKMRVLSPDKVRGHQHRSVLNKCIGVQLFVQPDITRVSLQSDDKIILCSDGVWSVIEDAEFAEVVRDSQPPEHLSQQLIDLALAKDSDDNVSALVVHIQQTTDEKIGETRPWSFSRLMRGRFGNNT